MPGFCFSFPNWSLGTRGSGNKEETESLKTNPQPDLQSVCIANGNPKRKGVKFMMCGELRLCCVVIF